MAQRASGYDRRPDEAYNSPAWLAATITPHLRRFLATRLWEPAAGSTALANALTNEGFKVIATRDDFFLRAHPPANIDAIVTNPPYGDDRGGRLACAFIRHALSLRVRVVAMLLRVDFDSGKTRTDLFRDNPTFAGKITLLDRIKWFEGPSQPSDNHAWFLWNRGHRGDPGIAYATRDREAA